MADKGAHVSPAPPLPNLPSKEDLAAKRAAEGFVVRHSDKAEEAPEPAVVAAVDEPAAAPAAAPAPAAVAAAVAAPPPPAAAPKPAPAPAPAAPKPAAPAAAPAAPKPAAPAPKPAAPKAPAAAAMTRRGFNAWFAMGWTMFTLATVGA